MKSPEYGARRVNERRLAVASDFARRVVAWQKTGGRHDLPWQGTRDAYRVWLSEIMLQQTQVRTVIPYYLRFVARFPTLEALARAPLDDVLALWAGLGYYARARHLHRCARTVWEMHEGLFPSDPAIGARLPGIGRSTAAAIAVFAFGRRAAILDGNVKRVLARCFAVEGGDSAAGDERALWALAESLLPEGDIECYTQGMMDLGATICTRGKPLCQACPLHGRCLAERDGRQEELPRRQGRKALPCRQSTVLLLCDGERVLCERRPPSGIWGGLLSLPEGTRESAGNFAARHGYRLVGCHDLPPITHDFSHFRLRLDVLLCRVDQSGAVAGEACWQWLAVDGLADAALPSPIRKLLLSAPWASR